MREFVVGDTVCLNLYGTKIRENHMHKRKGIVTKVDNHRIGVLWEGLEDLWKHCDSCGNTYKLENVWMEHEDWLIHA